MSQVADIENALLDLVETTLAARGTWTKTRGWRDPSKIQFSEFGDTGMGGLVFAYELRSTEAEGKYRQMDVQRRFIVAVVTKAGTAVQMEDDAEAIRDAVRADATLGSLVDGVAEMAWEIAVADAWKRVITGFEIVTRKVEVD